MCRLQRIEFRQPSPAGALSRSHEFERLAGQLQSLLGLPEIVVLGAPLPGRKVLVPNPVTPLHLHLDLRLPIAEVAGHQVPQRFPRRRHSDARAKIGRQSIAASGGKPVCGT